MKISIRTSPVHFAMAHLNPVWGEARQMQVALTVGDAATEAARKKTLALADVSFLDRFGLKGPNAQAWLEAQGVKTPAGHNQWLPLAGGGAIMRLGYTEFFLEDGPEGDTVARIRDALGAGLEGVYPVRRQDAALVLAGEQLQELLLQTCNVNFAAIRAEDPVVVMTSMVGVSVTVIASEINQTPVYRVWCDGTFGPYLWETLLEITEEIGGGAIGVKTLYPQLNA